ncbi:MAG: NUDIX hydrolase [Myxococcota bacterium]
MSIPLQQAGVIPYRYADNQIQLLLITSTRTGQWQFPKGMVEPYLTPLASALQEAHEEAGAIGQITSDGPLTTYTYAKPWGVRCVVDLYAMQVKRMLSDDEWLEHGHRQRQWVGPDQARQLIRSPALQRCLNEFTRWLANHPQ